MLILSKCFDVEGNNNTITMMNISIRSLLTEAVIIDSFGQAAYQTATKQLSLQTAYFYYVKGSKKPYTQHTSCSGTRRVLVPKVYSN